MTARTASRCDSARPASRRGWSLLGRIALWRSRRALLSLDEHMLNDIGLTADEARAEASRPVWDAPRSWRL